MSFPSCLRRGITVAAMLLLTSIAAAQAPADPEAQLIEVLTSDAASAVDKANACRLLRVVGTEKSVPALAALLADERLSHAARIALEPMPYPEAGEALRAALEKTEGLTRVGIITSLGNRLDEQAVPLLAPLLESDDKATGDAAVLALGKIGATKHLLDLIGSNRVVFHIGAIKSDDPIQRQAAARQLADVPLDTLKQIAAEFGEFPPDSQIALLAAIRIRRVKDLTPVVINAAKSDNPNVQLAALRALGQMGDRTALPLLIEHALGGDGFYAPTALESLTRLHAPGVDDDLRERLLAKQDPARRVHWIALIGPRNPPGLAELLLGEATHDSPQVRQVAMAGLAQIASPAHLPAMTKAVLVATPGAERDEAEKAVMLVARQLADPAQQASPALEVYRQATPADQQALLPLLGRIGGDEAKQIILAIMISDDTEETSRDAAVRALANWPDASVAGDLRALAQQADNPRHRQWALRALIRVVSLPDAMPDDQKLAELNQAIDLAQRDDERRLALQRMASVRTIESLRTLVPYLDNPELSPSAAKSIVELARHQHLRNPHKEEFIAALEHVIAAPTTDEPTRRQATRHLQAARQ